MHSVTGKVTNLANVEAGYGENARAVGVLLTAIVDVPWVKVVDGKGNNAMHRQQVSMFYPLTEMPPNIGDEVTMNLEVVVPDEEDHGVFELSTETV